MKSTGIVRKLDHLGRIVLPKELRRTLDLPEGAPMEIFVDGNRIVLRKYQAVGAWSYEEMWVWDNYNVLISVPATDGNFKASLNKASQKDLLRARDYLALHTFGNKNRTRAVQGEIRRRERKAKS